MTLVDAGRTVRSRRRTTRLRMDLLSSALMAAATVATAYSAYQSSLWNSEYARHKSTSTTATIKAAELSNLALQRTGMHVSLFVQWVAAARDGKGETADFLLARLPEPLGAVTREWWASNPLTNPQAAASPFELPGYRIREREESVQWAETAERASDAAERASATSNRYLLFTIVFASVLFFAGISGKFGLQAIDVAVLVLGLLTLLVGVTVMLASPRA